MNNLFHYCGHIISSDASGRFPMDNEQKISHEITHYLKVEKPSAGFGSLASGADIMFAESFIKLGAKLHVVLPFAKHDFVQQSVIHSGGHWQQRFEQVYAQAETLTQLYYVSPKDENIAYALCTEIAMGLCIIEIFKLQDSCLTQLTVWDQQITSGMAGTFPDMLRWGNLHLQSLFIDSKTPGTAELFTIFEQAPTVPLSIGIYKNNEQVKIIEINTHDDPSNDLKHIMEIIKCSQQHEQIFIDLDQQEFGVITSSRTERITTRAMALLAFRCYEINQLSLIKQLLKLQVTQTMTSKL